MPTIHGKKEEVSENLVRSILSYQEDWDVINTMAGSIQNKLQKGGGGNQESAVTDADKKGQS